VLIASRGDQMPETYKRYLTNHLRDDFELRGVPIRLFVRQGKNPYKDKPSVRKIYTRRD
jgi:GTPase